MSEKKRAYVASTILGLFAFDEDGKLVGHVDYPREPEAVAERMRQRSGDVPEAGVLKGELADYVCIFDEGNSMAGGLFFRRQLDDVLVMLKVEKREYDSLLRAVSFILAKGGLKEAMGREDLALIQAVEAIEDVDEALNILAERLREWYSLHFPELSRSVANHEKYAELIEAHGSRRGFEASEEYGEMAKESGGAELEDTDLAVLKNYALKMKELYSFRASLDSYLSDKMQALAPNIAILAGPLVGAKLISLAGGLEKLAKMPGSRIQVLGAEKAMFRHIRERGLPPKHGVILQHPLLKMAPWWQRGRIARSFAAKIAIAARADAFSKEYVADKLKEALDVRVEGVRRTAEPKRMRIIRQVPRVSRKFKKRKWRRG